MGTRKNGSKSKKTARLRKGGKVAPRPKPETDIVLLGELEEAVSRLAGSPRFDFLKNLIVSEFTASRATTPLGSVTLGDLSDRLRTTDSLGDDIARLSPTDQERLLKSIAELGSLADPIASSPEFGGLSSPSSPDPTALALPPAKRLPREEAPILSSVEAERRLTDAITALKSAPNFHLIKFSRLGDFWEEGWQRAPFEEALTLQQITEMKVAVMLEKRSFGPTKIFNFVRAIERAVGKNLFPHPLDAPRPNPTNAPPQIPPTPPASSATPSFWTPGGVKLPAHATATLRYLESIAASTPTDDHPLTRVLAQLPATLTATETAVLWFRQDSSNDVVASLMHLAPVATFELFESANNKLAALFRDVAPSESRSWLMALRSPGISLEELLAVLPPTTLPAEATVALGRMVLVALGATHPTIFGRTLDRYYTQTADAAELIVKNLIGNLPQSDEQVRKELLALLPFIDPEEMKPILLVHATFNERDRIWSKR